MTDIEFFYLESSIDVIVRAGVIRRSDWSQQLAGYGTDGHHIFLESPTASRERIEHASRLRAVRVRDRVCFR